MTELLTRAASAGTASAADAPGWIDELDQPLVCIDITDVTHDVRSFTFAVPGGAALRWLPGQYLTLRLDLDGVPVDRCYTIASAPTRPEQLTITVKRVPGGPVSNWLHDRLQPGDTVSAAGPLGRFSCALHPAERYLFLSAGSGITPMMSMLRTLCDTREPADIVPADIVPADIGFVHCARTPADIIFRAELDALATQCGVQVTVLCEDDAPSETWGGRYGRLDLPAMFSIAPDLLDREIFNCGPPPYMAAVREMLGQFGVEPVRYHEESFLLGGNKQDQQRPQTGVRHRVEFRRSGVVLDCDAATPLLTAASNAGLALPSSCTEGVCGTCKAQLLSGSVEMRHNGGIRQREIEAGKILPCCSTPAEGLIIDA